MSRKRESFGSGFASGCGCVCGVLFAVTLLGCGVFYFLSHLPETPSRTEDRQQVQKPSHGITLANYNQIQNGMTYNQVVEILGRHGVESSQAAGEGVAVSLITWEVPDGLGSNMNITFQNGRVTGKAQLGLR